MSTSSIFAFILLLLTAFPMRLVALHMRSACEAIPMSNKAGEPVMKGLVNRRAESAGFALGSALVPGAPAP